MNDTIRTIIIEKLALSGLSQEKVDTVITTLGEHILERVMMKVMLAMTDEEIVTFENLIAVSGESVIAEFLSSTVKDLDSIVSSCSQEVIDEFINA